MHLAIDFAITLRNCKKMEPFLEKSIKNILIIGDGIAGTCIRYELAKNDNFQITQVTAPDHFPACSLRSTAINCLRGTKKGLSSLGDEIVDSYEDFLYFLSKEKPDGIYQGSEIQFFENKENWEKRYPNFSEVKESSFNGLIKDLSYYYESIAYFFDVIKFKTWVESKSPKVEKKIGLVQKINDNGEVLIEDQLYQFDLVILTTNYGTKFLSTNLSKEYKYKIDHSKSVAGSFLEIDAKKINFSYPRSVSFSLEKYHFIYRKEQQLVQIGATTENNTEIFIPNQKELQNIYEWVKQRLKIDLPSFEEFHYLVGIRHKGYKRMPFHDFIGDKLFAVSGLYKNGFLLSFKIAKNLASLLLHRTNL